MKKILIKEKLIKENQSLLKQATNKRKNKKTSNIKNFFLNYKNKKKHRKKNKIKIYNKSKKKYFIIFIVFLIILSFYFIYIKLIKKTQFDEGKEFLNFNRIIEKDENEEYEAILNFTNLTRKGILFDKDKIYYPSKNPKISIVLSNYNGEGYIKNALLSIQNQDLKDIEIIMVDDGSKDNSVNLIKELMKLEPRIVLIENKENKGALYTKTKGMLEAKGKYIMSFDVDDMYTQRDALSTLYIEAEKNNLDILGFLSFYIYKRITRHRSNYGDKYKHIIYQPELSNLMYYLTSSGKVEQFNGNLVNYIVKTDLFKQVIKLIDEKNLNIKTNYHDDYILFFLLTRNAHSIKYIDRTFYLVIYDWDNNDPKIKFRWKLKNEYSSKNDIKCQAYLNFLDILFKNTKDTVEDKTIFFQQAEKFYLNNFCKDDKNNREKAIELFKICLENKYISDTDKDKIKNFITSSN